MTPSNQLAKGLRGVVLGGNQIANTNYKEQLQSVDINKATKKIDDLNTISLLAQHTHYYIEGVRDAIVEGNLAIRDKYSFKFSQIRSQKDWLDFLNKFWKDTEELAQLIDAIPETKLREHFIAERYGSYTQNIRTMIEHCYYHLGQIVLLKKMIE
ncbi:DUF1572 family protein [Dokdonia sp. Hel_I_53]|uniref:DUF1572 family protein n=1 Tax=Dokdonia sp. Hel_I_53 TaxID=1566287 RepID=UPI00119A7218|nr:DUF1572 family protein [Dokdonia sp. Hel_I_53]TVZ51592.1 uncharacterized protein DUF1572 [Dokdonia sp. Hel_I_53]